LNYKNFLAINFDTVKDMVIGQRKENVITTNETICRDKKTTSLLTRTEEKEYRIIFDKRVIQENYGTFPFGM